MSLYLETQDYHIYSLDPNKILNIYLVIEKLYATVGIYFTVNSAVNFHDNFRIIFSD